MSDDQGKAKKAWFVRFDGKTAGPFSSDRLKVLCATGKVPEHSEVSSTQTGPWHSITKMKGLTWPERKMSIVPPVPVEQAYRYESYSTPPPQPQQAQIPIQIINQLDSGRSGSDETEQILWKGNPSQWNNLRTFILCGLFFWLVIPIFVAIWRYFDTKFTRFELTNERLKSRVGVITARHEELELYRVKDSTFTQTFLQRCFGLATIRLDSSDVSTPTSYISGIMAKEAKPLRETIRRATERRRDKKRVREVDYN